MLQGTVRCVHNVCHDQRPDRPSLQVRNTKFGIDSDVHAGVTEPISKLDVLNRRLNETLFIEATDRDEGLTADQAARSLQASDLYRCQLVEKMVSEVLCRYLPVNSELACRHRNELSPRTRIGHVAASS
jgi:hypothetical protein